MRKGMRTFWLTTLALIIFLLIGMDGLASRDFLWLGLGLGLLVAPKAIKDIFEYISLKDTKG